MRTELLAPLMEKIIRDDNTHARWLNTLSYLEYIGFRKILKSQPASLMNQATLLHANEEGRHALLLKNLCLKVGGEAYDSYASETLLCGEEAENYFQLVDAGAMEILSEIAAHEKLTRLTYYAVTWLVEVRALEVYGAYMHAMKGAGLASPLSSLLKEEERHLDEVTGAVGDLLSEPMRERLQAMETRAYLNYVHALNRALDLKESPSAQAH